MSVANLKGALVAGLTVLACASGALPAGAAKAPAEKSGVTVAAAADLKFAMDEIIGQFHRQRPDIRVRVTYGSSGNFYSQLSNQAPFDVFFSADREFVAKLAAQDLTLPGSEFLYAVGRIVLWVPQSSPLPIASQGIAVLKNRAVRRISIANPRHAPYGRAAVAAMRSLDVYEAVKDKLVLGENVAQAAQFVQTGAAEAGIIALSLALAPSLQKKGKIWHVPLNAYPRMDQAGVILKWARNPAAAQAFRAFILSPAARSVMKKYGFGLPEN